MTSELLSKCKKSITSFSHCAAVGGIRQHSYNLQYLFLKVFGNHPSLPSTSWPFLPSGVHKLQGMNLFSKYKKCGIIGIGREKQVIIC